jgi:hypothetical protein
LIVGERFDLLRHDAFALGLVQDFGAVDAAAVVGNADRDAGALAHCRQDDLSLGIFLAPFAFGGCLDAVIYGVP